MSSQVFSTILVVFVSADWYKDFGFDE